MRGLKHGELLAATQGPMSERPKTPKAKRGKMTPRERAYVERCISFGCILTYFKTGIKGTPAEYHHRRTGTGSGVIASHAEGIALSPEYHRLGNEAIHVMGRKAWEAYHGVTELELIALSRKVNQT